MRLVVVGGVAAGLSAAARARRLDPSLEIVILERGETIAYAACGLPYYVEGQAARIEDLIHYTPEEFARQRGVTVRTKADVVSISHARREVRLATGETIPYDRLVIATGASPDIGSITGADQPHVYRLHTLQDAERLRAFLRFKSPRNAAVIGAGYIGLEAAEALRTWGLTVTLLESSGALLARNDEWFVRTLTAWLETFGVRVHLNMPVRQIDSRHVHGIPADLVVIAAGLRPNVEIAAEAGISLGRSGAIQVNEFLETNLAGVYAAGDCAEVRHLLLDRSVWVPLGTTANKMGRVAGANAVGRRERFPGIVGTSIVRVCGTAVARTGLSPLEARSEGFHPVWARIEAPEKPAYFFGTRTTVELTADARTGRILGGCVIGEQGAAGRVNVIATAVTAGLNVNQFAQLDLAYSPPYANVWDPLLIAAQQLEKQL